MRILLTNDDGVYAAGLAALHAALNGDHELVVVAPETEQSAVGHAITLADPIRVRRLGPRTGFDGWAVTGTPADCVKLAVSQLMAQRPDLVIGGINRGANVGVNLLYSGTVSSATEAAILGIPGIAVSLNTHATADYSFAAKFTAHLVSRLPKLPPMAQATLNVNVPALPEDQIKGVLYTRQSQARLVESFIQRQDPRGQTYYWQAGETMGRDGGPDTDYDALEEGYVTITPVRHDLTHSEALDMLKKQPLGLPPRLAKDSQ
jgi:5'-nucleotidase